LEAALHLRGRSALSWFHPISVRCRHAGRNQKDRRASTVPATVRGIQSRNNFTSFLDDVRQVKEVFKKEAGKEKRRVRYQPGRKPNRPLLRIEREKTYVNEWSRPYRRPVDLLPVTLIAQMQRDTVQTVRDGRNVCLTWEKR
jgi:hypothetical protein